MEAKNNIMRIKELITLIQKADDAYYGGDDPIMTDREYDALMEELTELEKTTGIVFANSPSKKVGGSNKAELQKVPHSKPMLSAKKTKSVEDMVAFFGGGDVMLSWKMDGLTIVLRYENGKLQQAITRGEDGLVGEDITHTVRYLRNVPHTVKCKDYFEVRGEGVLSWADYRLVNRNNAPGHPRNMAAGLVRSTVPDKGNLAHMDFYAFELIYPENSASRKQEQMDFLTLNGFDTVEYCIVSALDGEGCFRESIGEYKPEKYAYPVDGVIAEYDDLAYGRSLGVTAHHENRMIALKWEDEEHETVFRGVELGTTRSGMITLTAKFDPVSIDGTFIKRADLHSLGFFEKLKLGIGDTIKVYKANMIIPQISANVTQSGNYQLPDRCPCCGNKLEIKVSSGGNRNLYCPNSECIARNARKIARFCDKDAMNMVGFNASVLENLMAYGIVKNYVDLYKLKEKRETMLTILGMGFDTYEKLVSGVEKARYCHLAQLLVAVGIPLMGAKNAREIDAYFEGSWTEFEKAVKNDFCFFHIEGVSQALSRSIHSWYRNEEEQKLWRPVLEEITFVGQPKEIGAEGTPFQNAVVVVTGSINGMSRGAISELLSFLGATVADHITADTKYLLIGARLNPKEVAIAMEKQITIVTESQFVKLLSECELKEEEETQ